MTVAINNESGMRSTSVDSPLWLSSSWARWVCTREPSCR